MHSLIYMNAIHPWVVGLKNQCIKCSWCHVDIEFNQKDELSGIWNWKKVPYYYCNLKASNFSKKHTYTKLLIFERFYIHIIVNDQTIYYSINMVDWIQIYTIVNIINRNLPSTFPTSKTLQKCGLFKTSAPRNTKQSIRSTCK